MSKIELGKKRAEELGLKWQRMIDIEMYYADDIHKLLGDGQEVHNFMALGNRKSMWYESTAMSLLSTPDWEEIGLVIGVRPIHKDTAESLLRELMKYDGVLAITTQQGTFEMKTTYDIFARAKKLLGME